MKNKSVFLSVAVVMLSAQANASDANHESVSDGVIAEKELSFLKTPKGKVLARKPHEIWVH